MRQEGLAAVAMGLLLLPISAWTRAANLPYRNLSQRYAELDSQHILERDWLQRGPGAHMGRALHQGEPVFDRRRHLR